MNDDESILFVSDTHCRQRDLEVTEYLFHCGDLTNYGRPQELVEGFQWLESLPHKHKAFLPGNHDVGMRDPDMLEAMELIAPSVTILGPGITVVGGLLVAAMPFVRRRGGGYEVEEWLVNEYVASLRCASADVLVTHSPPHGILDTAPRHGSIGAELYVGLAKRLGASVHAFGHMHEHGHQRVEIDGVHYINAAMLDREHEWIGEGMRHVLPRVPTCA